MSQIWRGVSGGIEVLENVNEMADLPDISTIDSEGVWDIESGEFGPDYIAPTNWDSSAGEFTDWFSLFDGQILADIPDNAVAQWVADDIEVDDGETVTEWEDRVNGYDLTNEGSPTFRESEGEMNEEPAVELDGDSDGFVGPNLDESGPWTVILAIQQTGNFSDNNHWFDGGQDDVPRLDWDSDGLWEFNPFEDAKFDGSSDEDVTILVGAAEDGDNILREDGSETGSSSDTGVINIEQVYVGFGSSDRWYSEGFVSWVEIHDTRLSTSEIEERESIIAEKYGVSLD